MFGVPGQANKPEEEEPPRGPDEFERLLAFEEEMLRRLGFNPFQAAALAEARISWHQADDLLKRGCSLETAVDLLL